VVVIRSAGVPPAEKKAGETPALPGDVLHQIRSFFLFLVQNSEGKSMFSRITDQRRPREHLAHPMMRLAGSVVEIKKWASFGNASLSFCP
jgi:hypothetical protein